MYVGGGDETGKRKAHRLSDNGEPVGCVYVCPYALWASGA